MKGTPIIILILALYYTTLCLPKKHRLSWDVQDEVGWLRTCRSGVGRGARTEGTAVGRELTRRVGDQEGTSRLGGILKSEIRLLHSLSVLHNSSLICLK